LMQTEVSTGIIVSERRRRHGTARHGTARHKN